MAIATTDPRFLSEVEQMVKMRGEILVEFRYSTLPEATPTTMQIEAAELDGAQAMKGKGE